VLAILKLPMRAVEGNGDLFALKNFHEASFPVSDITLPRLFPEVQPAGLQRGQSWLIENEQIFRNHLLSIR
jgi:hypothetical protein